MKTFLKFLIYPLFFLSVRFLYLFRGLPRIMSGVYNHFYSEWKRNEFRKCPGMFNGGGIILPSIQVIGGKYVTIGERTYIGKGSIIGARDKYGAQTFNPTITIGNQCGFGAYTHITAINQVVIGDGVLLGNFVTISDNAHGGGDDFESQLSLPPILRPLFSKGPVIINENVWIGDKATILSGVTIGKGAIVGANSVVTKDVPPRSVVAGCPARLIRMIK